MGCAKASRYACRPGAQPGGACRHRTAHRPPAGGRCDAMCTRIWWVRPGMQGAAHQAGLGRSVQQLERCARACRHGAPGSTTAMRRRLRGSRPMAGIAPRAGRTQPRAVGQRQVLAAAPRGRRSCAPGHPCRARAGHHHQAAGVLVQPVHDARARQQPRLAASRASRPLSSVPLQLPGAGMHHQPGRLVDDAAGARPRTPHPVPSASGKKAWLCGVGRSSISPRSPALTRADALIAGLPFSVTAPASINCCR
jgi:hypothetical protein